ncbi:MAG TPA: acyl-CoA dehydrogenase family protein [Acidimicrobiales bacterium]|jgi:alkylation response protein AidB-like acyl-CoA dehydrogenase|nr:acyl-CoA dehydrogenase family protein [Acidimicrobiales bacterium]
MGIDGSLALAPDPAPGDDPDPVSPGPERHDELRRSLTDWLRANLTPEVVAAGQAGMVSTETVEILRAWNRVLADAGWAAISWPAEYGGRDASVAEQLAFYEVMTASNAPGPVNVIGVANVAPAIMAVGTPEQKDRYLAPMLRGDEIWCQGMSEPDSGSDLASLRTTALADGEEFVINGQKTWNSLGQYADWCQLYARTDPTAPKHKGISCLLVDMRSAGVEARPLRTMTGEAAFSELFFTDVRVPATALLGPIHEGWRVAMTTLSYERAGVARLHLGLTARFNDLVAEARQSGVEATSVERDRLAQLYAFISCMRWMTTRELEAVGRGGQPSPAMGSLAKLMWARATQELADLAVSLLGSGGLAGNWTSNFIAAPGVSIAGGTSDINRNIVAEHGLGLPR